MYLINRYHHELKFYIDLYAPPDYINRWNTLKKICEEGDVKDIIKDTISYCKLEQNKNLPYLKRCEGGIGGDDNIINKQIRFRHISISNNYYNNSPYKINEDQYICFCDIRNTDFEKWTYEELDDIIDGFVKMANNYVGENCINGHIEMFNKKNDYSDSDD